MKLISSYWYSNKGLLVFNEDQEFIRVVQIVVKSDSKKVSYRHGLEICKKALNLVITNSMNKGLEDLLQKFINNQISKHNTASEQSQQGSGQEIEGRGRLANKRYLSAVENHDTKCIQLSNQDKLLESETKKKNKHQCT
ncbi:38879_t:CDS:2, partial [Gigaspora margarita]